MKPADALRIFVIYDRPRDYQVGVVVRAWTIAGGVVRPDNVATFYDARQLGQRHALAAARSYCKQLGLTYVARRPGDDPAILETWL